MFSCINEVTSQLFIHVPRKDSVFSIKNRCFKLDFDVLSHSNARYGDEGDICFVKLGRIAPFSEDKLKTGSGRQLKFIFNAQPIC